MIKKNEEKKESNLQSSNTLQHGNVKEGLSIESIAAKHNFSVGTIIRHIEKLIGLKLIDHSVVEYLKNMLPKIDFELILSELEKSADGKLTPIYEKFGGKYSYANIQFVRLFVGQK